MGAVGVISIINAASGITTLATGFITQLIAIKNALSKSGADFDVEVRSLDGDIVKTTGDTVADADAWLAAHPE